MQEQSKIFTEDLREFHVLFINILYTKENMTEIDKKTNSKKGNSCMRDFEPNDNEWFGDEDSGQSREDITSNPAEPSDSDRDADNGEVTPLKSDSNRDGYGYSYSSGDFRPEPKQPKKQKNGTSLLLISFCLILFIFIGVSIGVIFNIGGGFDHSDRISNNNAGTNGSSVGESSQTGIILPAETAPGATVIAPDTEEYISIFREVSSNCLKTVVQIYVQTASGSGAGSGVIYDSNGYIVTNYHVADNTATSITVILYDGTEYAAKFIYGDELADISVIKIEKTDCEYATFGDSDQMTYGDLVLAIGNPQGLGLSVTDGIISRPGENVTVGNATMTLLRTSAAINGGNSGGGLFNMRGELIGIVNAKLAASSIDNIGYAIPSTTVVKCLNDLKAHGYITGRAYLGVVVETKQYTSWPYQYNLLQIQEILENGSAAQSDLRVGDILYQYEGKNITSFEVLSQQLTKYSVGDTVKLTVLRPTIEYTGKNAQQYINSAQEVEIEITFVEFNPNR